MNELINPKTLKELIEFLQTLPQDAKPTYDDGLKLWVEYCEEDNRVDFH